MTDETFIPALGYAFLTPLYDSAIAVLTREQVWSSALVAQVDPMPGDRILVVGCGTGALAKATKRDVDVNWKQGFLTPEIANDIGTVSKIVSSLVFHQTPMNEKANILSVMRGVRVNRNDRG